MRKIILLFVSALILCNLNAQQDSTSFVSIKNKAFVISNVETVEGTNSSDLYKKALQWASSYFVANRTEYMVTDPVAGVIVLNGVGEKWYDLKFVLKIQTKNNKYKWSISNINKDYESRIMRDLNMSFEEYLEEEKDQDKSKPYVFMMFENTINDLESYMNNKVDW